MKPVSDIGGVKSSIGRYGLTRWLFCRVHLIVAAVLGASWSGVYLFLARLHGMGPMFERTFPTLTMSLLGLDPVQSPEVVVFGLVVLDGLIIGFILGLIVRLILPPPPGRLQTGASGR